MRRTIIAWFLSAALLLLGACSGDGSSAPAPTPAPVNADTSVPKTVEPSPVPAEPLLETPAPDPRLLAKLPVGQNPQQIAFSEDGSTVYVAAGMSHRITVVDATSREIRDAFPVAGIPMGLAVVQGTGKLLVSLFEGDEIDRQDPDTGELVHYVGSRLELLDAATGTVLKTLAVERRPSFLVGPLPDGSFVLSIESGDRFIQLDPAALEIVSSFPTPDRPFPPLVTSDGKLAFVGTYTGGMLVIVSLEAKAIQQIVTIGERISGGIVLPGDDKLALVYREQNRIALLDLASRQQVGSIEDGIGAQPLAVTLSPDGRLAFVNNTESADISVIRVSDLSVVDRVPVGGKPASISVHPSGKTVWVSCEGDHQVYVLEVQESWL